MGAARREVIIFGAGGLGAEVLETILAMAEAGTPVGCAGFLVDRGYPLASPLPGLPVFDDAAVLQRDPAPALVVALGDPRARAAAVARLTPCARAGFATVVHPRAAVGGSVEIGEGSVVLQMASVTARCRIGRHALLNPFASVAHDTVLSDFATLSPGVCLAGHVRIDEGAELGTGAVVLPRERIGAWARVGAGAVVLRSVETRTTVAGVPARPLSKRGSTTRK